MRIKSGTSRLVICFPRWGLVIKLPRPKPIAFLRQVLIATKVGWRTGDMKRWLKRVVWPGVDSGYADTIQYTLLNGMYQNWLEWRLWQRTRSPLLAPTLFSLGGLVNIQKYADPLTEIQASGFWTRMVKLTEMTTVLDPSVAHHFADPTNFALGKDGRLIMIDYGGCGVETVVVSYGEQIVLQFRLD